MSDTQLAVELTEQVYSYIELSALYEQTPSVQGFIDHLKDAYDGTGE